MISSFVSVIALANFIVPLQNTFSAGDRVIDILDEQPVTEDIVNGKDVEFTGVKCENVTFSYGNEIILDNLNRENYWRFDKTRIAKISFKISVLFKTPL